jgi:glycerol-3-phosphate acyltransferase PlsY
LPDPRTYGSGNIGATNVLRSGSRVAALATLVGDLAKGWVAVLVRATSTAAEMVALVGFRRFLGHLFPVWLRFKGGKGVATAAGVLIAFDWRLGVAVIVVWLTMAVVSRYSRSRPHRARSSRPWRLVSLGAGPLLVARLRMSVLLWRGTTRTSASSPAARKSRIGEEEATGGPAHERPKTISTSPAGAEPRRRPAEKGRRGAQGGRSAAPELAKTGFYVAMARHSGRRVPPRDGAPHCSS